MGFDRLSQYGTTGPGPLELRPGEPYGKDRLPRRYFLPLPLLFPWLPWELAATLSWDFLSFP